MTTEICSMTAYANCQQAIAGIGSIHVEAKSVNSKFLDLNIKIPDYLSSFEPAIRRLISNSIKRGKVDYSLSINFDNAYSFEHLYGAQIRNYITLHADISKQLFEAGINSQDLTIIELIKYITSQNTTKQTWTKMDNAIFVDIQNVAENLTSELIEKFKIDRIKEGQGLRYVLQTILKELQGNLTALEKLLPQAQEDIITKFKFKLEDIKANFINTNISTINSDINSDFEQRVAQEVSIYLNKIDVAEELARLKIHAEEVKQTLDAGGVVGRKLDFLMQELMREANTLSAKSVNIEFRNYAINMKLNIEQMREQIQNIE